MRTTTTDLCDLRGLLVGLIAGLNWHASGMAAVCWSIGALLVWTLPVPELARRWQER